MKLLPSIFALVLAAGPLAAQAEAPATQATATAIPDVPKSKPRVRLMTSFGAIVLELEPDATPKTVENFLTYVKEGHYSGTIFHRVEPGFMVQGGGFDETLKEKPTHAAILNEAPESFAAGLKNTVGTVAMARTSASHSSTAQFYINTADNPKLDYRDRTPDGYGYCVFGRVVEGMDVVTKIEKVITVWRHGLYNVPEYPVRIKSAEILPEGKPEAVPEAPKPAAKQD